MNGRQYPAEQALKLGMIDSIVHREQLTTAATKKIQQSGGKKRSSKMHLSNRPPLSQVIKSQAEKKALARTHGHYPAPLKALEVACASLNFRTNSRWRTRRINSSNWLLSETAQNLDRSSSFFRNGPKKLKLPKEFERAAGSDR